MQPVSGDFYFIFKSGPSFPLKSDNHSIQVYPFSALVQRPICQDWWQGFQPEQRGNRKIHPAKRRQPVWDTLFAEEEAFEFPAYFLKIFIYLFWLCGIFLMACGNFCHSVWAFSPVLLPGKSQGRRSLVGCSPWGREESDTTEWLPFHFSLSCIGEGNGNPFQCSCLENPRDGGAWWAAVYGVAQSWTRLKWLSSSSSSMGFLVVACGFSCSATCGILVPRPGIKPESLTLVGRFLTTGPPGKSCQGGFFKGLFVYFTDGCSRFSVAAHSLSLVGASGGYSLVAVRGLVIPAASYCSLWALEYGFRSWGIWACAIFPEQGLNLCPLHGQADF